MNVGSDPHKLSKSEAYFNRASLPEHWNGHLLGTLSDTHTFQRTHPRPDLELWTFYGTFKMPIMATYCIEPAVRAQQPSKEYPEGVKAKKAVYKTFYEGVWTYKGRMFRKGDVLVPML